MDSGYKGTSCEQDIRWKKKEAKLFKSMRFEDVLERKINMTRVKLDVLKPWITQRVNEILGIEDDVVVEYVINQLEEKELNPKQMQINLTGFLNARRAREFMAELWTLLVEAEESDDGIPKQLIEKKMHQMKLETDAGVGGAAKIQEDPRHKFAAAEWKHRYQAVSNGRFDGPPPEPPSPDYRKSERRRSRSPRRRDSPPPRRDRSPPRRGRSRSRSPRRDSNGNGFRAGPPPAELLRRTDARRRDDDGDKDRRRPRQSPPRRFAESPPRKRDRSADPVDDGSKKRKKKKHRRQSDGSDSDDGIGLERKKAAKKQKKEKKKKERRRSSSP